MKINPQNENKSKAEMILNRAKQAINVSTDIEFAALLGISKSTLSNWKSRDSVDYDLLFSKCEHLNLDWLLMGRGQMLRDEQPAQEVKPVVIYKSDPKDADLITAKNSIIALQEDKIRRLESLLMQHSTVLDIARSADLPSQQTEGTKPHKKHD